SLGWQPKYSIDDMMRTAWQWEQNLEKDNYPYQNPNYQMN
ncbi:MAG: UDP-glucose 4-epimerase GalE, partial [Flavisolibacter sp.]|nr:UDP-glucose 4-epimerase GalE [Flavisolibacter sp.]